MNIKPFALLLGLSGCAYSPAIHRWPYEDTRIRKAWEEALEAKKITPDQLESKLQEINRVPPTIIIDTPDQRLARHGGRVYGACNLFTNTCTFTHEEIASSEMSHMLNFYLYGSPISARDEKLLPIPHPHPPQLP